MAEQVFGVGGERQSFLPPVGQAEERSDSQAAKSCRIGPFSRFESPVVMFFGAGGVQEAIALSIVGFLVNHQSFGAGGDHGPVGVGRHRPYFQGQPGNRRAQGEEAILEVAVGNELRVFAGHQQNVAEALLGQRPGFAFDFGDGQGNPPDVVVAGKAAVAADVDAFVG